MSAQFSAQFCDRSVQVNYVHEMNVGAEDYLELLPGTYCQAKVGLHCGATVGRHHVPVNTSACAACFSEQSQQEDHCVSQGGCQTALVARLMTDGRTLGRQMDRSLTCVVPRCTGLTADAASLYCDYNTTWAEQQAASLDQSYFIMWEVAFVMVPIRVRCPPHSPIWQVKTLLQNDIFLLLVGSGLVL